MARGRVPWRHWHLETLTCGIRGHCLPAAGVVDLGDGDLGIVHVDGRRYARCLRCDSWCETTSVPLEIPVLPPRHALPRPRRGRALRDAIVLRIIAIDRAVHAVIFGLIAVALVILTLRLTSLQHFAQSLNSDLGRIADQTGPNQSRNFLTRQLHRVANLDQHSLHVLAGTAFAYCVIEAAEAVGLWRERRWAEYLTAVATAGFLPFEIHELIRRVTALRVGAIVVNLAVLVWLVYSKHLFGVRGGARAQVDAERAARDLTTG